MKMLKHILFIFLFVHVGSTVFAAQNHSAQFRSISVQEARTNDSHVEKGGNQGDDIFQGKKEFTRQGRITNSAAELCNWFSKDSVSFSVCGESSIQLPAGYPIYSHLWHNYASHHFW